MTNSQPPPVKVPLSLQKSPEQGAFLRSISRSLYELWSSLGGQKGGIIPDDRIDLSGKTTDDLSEGDVNLYFTEERFDASFSNKNSDDLSEGGVNLYYTQPRQDEIEAFIYFSGF